MFSKRRKSRKWLKKILKKDCSKIVSVNYLDYLHESDAKTLSMLKKIPFFDKLCSKFIEAFSESIHSIDDMANKIRINKNQIPRVYNMVLNISKKLGIDMPALYLELNRNPNAYTYGNEKATITITSGLLECLEDDELYAVLAHECGHISCKHVLYHTMGNMILNGGIMGLSILNTNGFLNNIITTPLKLAFYRWMRCSELSADRASVICCEGSAPVVETMMRLAGGTTHIDSEINKQAFVEQAEEYKGLMDEKKLNKAIEFLLIHGSTHPLLSVRAKESIEWEQTQQYKNIMVAMNG